MTMDLSQRTLSDTDSTLPRPLLAFRCLLREDFDWKQLQFFHGRHGLSKNEIQDSNALNELTLLQAPSKPISRPSSNPSSLPWPNSNFSRLIRSCRRLNSSSYCSRSRSLCESCRAPPPRDELPERPNPGLPL